MPRKHRRQIDAPAFAAGASRRRNLETGNVVSRYVSRVVYDYDMTGGSGAGGVRADAAFRLLDEITINVPGREGPRAVVSVHGHTLYKILKLLEPSLPPQVDPTSVAAAADEDERESIVPIPLGWLRSLTPHELALPTHALGGHPEMVVRWGVATDLFTDAIDGTPALSNETATLIEERIEGSGADPARIVQAGLHFLRKYRVEVTQSGQKTVDLEGLDGMDVARVFVQARDTGAGGGYEDSDDLVNTVELEIGGVEVVEALEWGALQSLNAEQYNLSSREAGVVVLDAAEDERTTRGEVWMIRGSRLSKVRLDVDAPTGDGEVVVTVEGAARRAAGRGNGRGGGRGGRGRG